jgi:hypothetical protein
MKNEEPKPIHQQIIDLVGGEDNFREIAGIKRKNNKTMKNKQTAVEYLMEQLKFINKEAYAHLSGGRERKAYAMEKEQIGRAYQEGLIDGMNHSPKEYYNENYGKN